MAVGVHEGRYEFASSPLPRSEDEVRERIRLAVELFDRLRGRFGRRTGD